MPPYGLEDDQSTQFALQKLKNLLREVNKVIILPWHGPGRWLCPLRVTARLGRDWQAFRGAVFLKYRRKIRNHTDA